MQNPFLLASTIVMEPASPGLHVYCFVIRFCYPRPLSRATYIYFRKRVLGNFFAFENTIVARDSKIVVVLDIEAMIMTSIGFPNGADSDNIQQY